MEQLTDLVIRALRERWLVELEASGRHVHLTREAADYLFGHGLTPERPLSQPGQYLCRERVSILGPKGRFDRVAVLGPERKSCQVEISRTDGVTLGVEAPVRPSGSIAGSPGITLEAEGRRLALPMGVIVAQRHIHMTPEDAARRGIEDGALVRLRTLTPRPVVFEEVLVRVSPDFRTYVHLDFDEANACGCRKGDLGLIL